ncbi:hypothetical protein ACH40E_06260 [Streptomyces acidicola]|uniref:effector-associated constant component EACC1 n=1 Tax=Streptomyces acidicola TaxID=2596892 RepID=UPI00378C246A
MRVQVRVAAADGGETLTDLYHWFRENRDLRRDAEVRIRTPRQTGGHMGAVEIIDLVLGHGTGVGALALAYATWRRTRPTGPEVTFTRDGVSVTARNADTETLRHIEELLRPQNDDDAGSTGNT